MKVGDLVKVCHWVNAGEKAIITKKHNMYDFIQGDQLYEHSRRYTIRIIRTGKEMNLRACNMEVISESR